MAFASGSERRCGL